MKSRCARSKLPRGIPGRSSPGRASAEIPALPPRGRAAARAHRLPSLHRAPERGRNAFQPFAKKLSLKQIKTPTLSLHESGANEQSGAAERGGKAAGERWRDSTSRTASSRSRDGSGECGSHRVPWPSPAAPAQSSPRCFAVHLGHGLTSQPRAHPLQRRPCRSRWPGRVLASTPAGLPGLGASGQVLGISRSWDEQMLNKAVWAPIWRQSRQ